MSPGDAGAGTGSAGDSGDGASELAGSRTVCPRTMLASSTAVHAPWLPLTVSVIQVQTFPKRQKKKNGHSEKGKEGMKRNSSTSSQEEKEKREKAKVETELKPLQDLTPEEVGELQAVCADAEVMRFVGDGKPWKPAYVEELCVWARKDAAASTDTAGHNTKDAYLHWALVEVPVVPTTEKKEEKEETENNASEPPAKKAPTPEPARKAVVVGYIGLRPVPRAPRAHTLQVRVFVARSHQGLGHARRALARAVAHARTALPWCPELAAFVREDNTASAALFAACGWQRRGFRWFGRERELVFVCPLPIPPSHGSSPRNA